MNNSYPTVATIIGCPEELKSADGLVATPLVIEEEMSMPEPSVQQLLPNDTSGIKDPVQKAIVDNILGKNSTKASPEKHRCDTCNIEVNGKAALLTHLSGARHAKKLKEDNLNKEPQNPHIEYLEDSKMYICKLCNTKLNARVQIMAHLQGSKHRGKVESSEKVESGPFALGKSSVTSSAPVPGSKRKDPQNPDGPVGLHLFCATCRIYTNSELQLQQHTSSKKHQNKFNGGGILKPRPAPYTVRSPKTMPMRADTSPLPPFSSSHNYRSPNNFIFQRRMNSSYNNQSYSPYGSLSNNFGSSSVYGGGNDYNHQPSYNRHSSFQTHTYG